MTNKWYNNNWQMADEGLPDEVSAVYINISILQYIEEDCRKERSTRILFIKNDNINMFYNSCLLDVKSLD